LTPALESAKNDFNHVGKELFEIKRGYVNFNNLARTHLSASWIDVLSFDLMGLRQDGRLAQLDRALVSGTKGRGFNSRIARYFFLPS
jgi:hypothetical protein